MVVVAAALVVVILVSWVAVAVERQQQQRPRQEEEAFTAPMPSVPRTGPGLRPSSGLPEATAPWQRRWRPEVCLLLGPCREPKRR